MVLIWAVCRPPLLLSLSLIDDAAAASGPLPAVSTLWRPCFVQLLALVPVLDCGCPIVSLGAAGAFSPVISRDCPAIVSAHRHVQEIRGSTR